MKKILTLFLTFLKIGAFTFGGGYAMIPLIQNEMVEKKKWITNEEMMDIIAIAEATPGVLAVNSATFVGYKVGKFMGGLMATFGVVLPSLIIITIISIFFKDFLEYKYVSYAFMGIRAGVAVLILNAALKMSKHFPKTKTSYILLAIAIIASLIFDIKTIYIIIFGIAAGIITSAIITKVNKTKEIKEGEPNDSI